MIKNIKEYKCSSANEYIKQDSKIIADKYLNEILNMFKNKEEFIRFHNINDDNLYIDTKEEETEHIQNVVNHALEKFANENKIVDQNQVTIDKKEELAEILLKLNVITYRDIASLCNLSFYKVTDIAKGFKNEN